VRQRPSKEGGNFLASSGECERDIKTDSLFVAAGGRVRGGKPPCWSALKWGRGEKNLYRGGQGGSNPTNEKKECYIIGRGQYLKTEAKNCQSDEANGYQICRRISFSSRQWWGHQRKPTGNWERPSVLRYREGGGPKKTQIPAMGFREGVAK